MCLRIVRAKFYTLFPAGFIFIFLCLPSAVVAQEIGRPAKGEQENLSSYMELALSSKQQGDLSTALTHFFTVLQLAEEEKDSVSVYTALHHIGELNSRMGYQDRAMMHMKRALDIATRKGREDLVRDALNGIGLVHLAQKNYAAAQKNFDRMIEKAAVAGDKKDLFNGYNNKGLLCSELGKTSEARTWYQKTFLLSNELNDTTSMAMALLNIADCMKSLGKPDSAIVCLEKALRWEKTLSPDLVQLIYGGLTLAYEYKKDYKQAFSYFKKHVGLMSDIYTSESDKTINELETKYQSEKKQREILQLKTDRQQQALQLSISENKLNYRTSLLVICSVVLLAILLFSWLLYRQNKAKTALNTLLTEQNKKIEEQKQALAESLAYTQKLQLALKQDLGHYMQSALRKQMNPHFIFNSLNSIQRFILQENKTAANDYLSEFSSLMRRVLQNSAKELISIKDELDTLKLYVDLEQKRFSGKFDYSIEVEEAFEPSLYMVPPLILQPYVENAIWHGLLHKDQKGELKISMKREGEYIVCSMEDNGVGREEAMKRKSGSDTHESLGIRITEKRMQAIAYLNKVEVTAEIEDLKDHEGKASGTRVCIHLPVMTIFQLAAEKSKA